MGNVQGEIDRISGAKTTLGDYLTQNGVSVASGDKIDTMASKLSTVTAKQDKITAKGILKGDGAGTITAAVAGTDYLTPQGNAATATKLANKRTIALGTGATGTATCFDGSGNITIPVTAVKEKYLSWGGKNIAGDISPVDASISGTLSGVRSNFMLPAGITIEYSTDSGATWTDYGVTDSEKIDLVSETTVYNPFRLGKYTSGATRATDQLRITIDGVAGGVYFALKTLCIYMSTGGASGCKCKVEHAQGKAGATGLSDLSFVTEGTYDVAGWSGWNSIPCQLTYGGTRTRTDNSNAIRLTFSITTPYSQGQQCNIQKIFLLGTTVWSVTSNLGRFGHIYAVTSSQNVTFPAKITAPRVVITKDSGFIYSSIGEATGNANRNVWFSDQNEKGTPVYNSNFKYNPSTNVLTVGSITGSAASASKVANALKINGKTYDGSAAVNAGVIGAAYGGSGKTTLTDSANAFINALGIGSSTPADNDYYISQYAGGGTTTTTYHRRPMSALWAYIKSKIPSWALAASKPTYTAAEVGAEASGAVSTHNTSTSAHSTLFANKVDKVSGKGLSTNDYTTAEKTKLSGIETGAQKNVQADWAATTGDAVILNKPTLPTVAQAQVTLTAAGWSGTTQTVTVSGVTADNMVIVTYAPGSREAWTDADIYCSAQAANALVFTCSDTPTEDVTANVAIFG